jgi:hypothetical protein
VMLSIGAEYITTVRAASRALRSKVRGAATGSGNGANDPEPCRNVTKGS